MYLTSTDPDSPDPDEVADVLAFPGAGTFKLRQYHLRRLAAITGLGPYDISPEYIVLGNDEWSKGDSSQLQRHIHRILRMACHHRMPRLRTHQRPALRQ